MKPYHTLLLLEEKNNLLNSLKADVSPALKRLLHVALPTNPFYILAADADLTLKQVYQVILIKFFLVLQDNLILYSQHKFLGKKNSNVNLIEII